MALNISNFKTLLAGENLSNPACISRNWEFTVVSRNTTYKLPIAWYTKSVNFKLNSINARTLSPYIAICRLKEGYFPAIVTSVNYSTNKTVTLTVKSHTLLMFVSFLKNNMFFNLLTLTDIWATDFPSRKKRFEVTYSLLSVKRNTRVYLKTFINEWDVIPSLTSLFDSAAWLEREIWDMFGIMFSGHNDLRRILTDYGFFGFPLRKDFPLTGFSELRYDDTTRRVASEHLNLIQELRLFFFATPWKKK